MSRLKIRLGLIDDHALFREGLKDLLLTQPDFEIVAEGGDGYDALSALSLVHMDVLLIDLRMPRLGGVSADRTHSRQTRPALKIIVVSMFEDDDHKRQAVSAGADGYHSKMDDAKSIIKTIRDLMAGKTCLTKEERRWISHRPAAVGKNDFVLTETEYRVLEELARGDSNRDIASRLAISEQTLKNHLSAVFKKLGAKNRLEAVRRAMERNLILPPV